jgi:hypothetical protein
MSEENLQSKSGPSLLELVLVVGPILTTTIALIHHALKPAQIAADDNACLFKIRGIPVMFRAYSTSWNGWTHLIDRRIRIALAPRGL